MTHPSHLPLFGHTRTHRGLNHAIITPDGFVPSFWPGANGATVYFHITPALGAGFVQFRANWLEDGILPLPANNGIQRFVFVVSGEVTLEDRSSIPAGGYLYLSSDESETLKASQGTSITVFEKRYEPVLGVPAPGRVRGDVSEVAGQPFLGNPRALLKVLLPDTPSFDMAVNLFTYEPGATLPFVETHIMEHGLLMVEGQGIYRLEDSWYPTKAGDVIWMGPYCPQWFVAMGDKPASYLYYKNVNRHPVLP
ncbi:MAG: (S)-ureidoglycine aminohydrolase [Terrimicrobiaceae bacterium]